LEVQLKTFLTPPLDGSDHLNDSTALHSEKRTHGIELKKEGWVGLRARLYTSSEEEGISAGRN
jgi:hypothetical protein